jgi:hypothetical protein
MEEVMNLEDLKNVLDYDPSSGKFTWKVKVADKITVGSRAGTNRKDGYRQIKLFGKYYLEHRLAWFWMKGEFLEHQVDHLNGVRDDNRWCNLREASPKENRQNTVKQKRNKTGFLGVRKDPRLKINPYQAHIGIGYGTKVLGNFATPEMAFEARLKAQKELYDFQPEPRR